MEVLEGAKMLRCNDKEYTYAISHKSYLKRRDRLLTNNKVHVDCVCGATVSAAAMWRHKRTAKHTRLLACVVA